MSADWALERAEMAAGLWSLSGFGVNWLQFIPFRYPAKRCVDIVSFGRGGLQTSIKS